MANVIGKKDFRVGAAMGRILGPAMILALLASALVPAAPAGAVNGRPDNLARYSACVGPAAASAGFADIRGSIAEAAVDCLVHYGITRGRTADRFSPAETVLRWQMALFLARAAAPAGITLPEATGETPFTDLSGLSEEARAAIEQLEELGVMTGAGGEFNPNGPVTRQDMAVFLDRFLRQAEVGPGGTDIVQVDPDDTHFDDIAEVPLAAFRAIRNLAEMGITGGTTPSTFSPENSVTRAQMALFITRTLAHANARPAGVTVQASALSVEGAERVEVTASVRGADHAPRVRAAVDAFLALGRDDSFNQRGECSLSRVTAVLGGAGACRIEAGDPLTDRLGNIIGTVDVTRTADFYAWTGGSGERFDRETTPAGRLSFEVAQQAADVKVSDDLLPRAQKVMFGRQVAFTFQLVDLDGDPVAEAGRLIRVATSVGQSALGRDRQYLTNHSGEATAVFSQTDPNPGDDRRGDEARIRLVVTPPAGFGIRDDTTMGLAEEILWSDEAAAPAQLILSQETVYQSASELDRGEENLVTAELRDQYGAPIYGRRIEFWSDDPAGVGGARDESPRFNQRTTNREGVATLRYTRDSAATGVERISAQYVVDQARASLDILAEPIEHFWVLRAFAQDNGEPREYADAQVLHHDRERQGVVARSGGVLWLITYGSGDQFTVDGASVSMARFQQLLNSPGYQTLTAVITDRSSVADSTFATGKAPPEETN